MTTAELEELQQDLQQSGLSMRNYFKQHTGINISSYYYWRKKLSAKAGAPYGLAPVTLLSKPSAHSSSVTRTAHGGVTLLFPNGLRAYFECDAESALKNLFDKSLPCDVLPE